MAEEEDEYAWFIVNRILNGYWLEECSNPQHEQEGGSGGGRNLIWIIIKILQWLSNN